MTRIEHLIANMKSTYTQYVGPQHGDHFDEKARVMVDRIRDIIIDYSTAIANDHINLTFDSGVTGGFAGKVAHEVWWIEDDMAEMSPMKEAARAGHAAVNALINESLIELAKAGVMRAALCYADGGTP